MDSYYIIIIIIIVGVYTDADLSSAYMSESVLVIYPRHRLFFNLPSHLDERGPTFLVIIRVTL